MAFILRRLIPAFLIGAALITVQSAQALAFARPSVGQLFISVAGSKVLIYSPSGKALGSLASAGASGVCFGQSGGLFVTGFDAGNIRRFDSTGKPIAGTVGASTGAESCVVMRNGNVLAGEAVGDHKLVELRPDGTELATFQPATESKGIDWVDIAADQCTVYYTSEGKTVKRFDICTQRQLPDFASQLQGSCYGQRLLPSGGELVACARQVYRLNPNGSIAQTYTTKSLKEGGTLFALNLDPDGRSFWTASFNDGNIYKVDLGSGVVVQSFSVHQEVDGLAVFGEPLAGGASFRSSFARVVPDLPALLAGLVSDPRHAAGNLLIALLSLLGIALSKEVFNQTVRTNYEEIRRWFRFWPPIERRLLAGSRGQRPDWQMFIAFSLVGGLLYGFLEPRFFTDLGETLAVFIGMSLALAVVVLVRTLSESRYVSRHDGGAGRLTFFPLALPVAVLSVVISRVVNFEPGYIYGVFVAVAFRRELLAAVEGASIALASWVTLGVSLAAWILWMPVESLTAPGAPFLVFVAENFLVLVFVLGLEALLFGLLPLQFLDGEKLFAWNRRRWLAIWGLTAFLALQVLINPSSRGRFVVSGEAGLVTWIALFVAFFALTAGLWLWFRLKGAGGEPPRATEEVATAAQPEPASPR